MPQSFVRLVTFVCAIVVVTQPGKVAASERAAAAAARDRGLTLGYNLDYAEALGAFREAIADDPDDPTAYELLAGAAWVALLFEQGIITVDDYLGQARSTLARMPPDAALDAAFHESLRRALVLSEDRLRRNPNDAGAHYMVGAAQGFLASYAATVEGRVLGSLGPARRAYREHDRVLDIDPARKDAGLIVGLYRYGVAALPSPLRLLAHLAGFGGGRERGLRLVEDAARFPSDVQSNAQFMLVLLYNREARYDDALGVIAELQGRYPRNRLLWLEAGGTAMRAGRPAAAKAVLEEGLARLSRDPRPRAFGEEARWRYLHGAALAALKDDSAAERELHAALAGATRDWVRGRAHKELGTIAARSGNRLLAWDEYRLADRLCRSDHDSDCTDDLKRVMR
jgi:tetratricopeptide (TPR) repeat protein